MIQKSIGITGTSTSLLASGIYGIVKVCRADTASLGRYLIPRS
jgi:hypothetical protein